MLVFILIGINVAISLWGFSGLKKAGFRRFLFMPYEVAHGRNLEGTLLSHFSHADLGHLFFNMLTLYIFGSVVEHKLGLHFLTIYGLAGLAATLLVFLLRFRNPNYRVLGASGSVTGILFAAIVLNPGMNVYFFVVPVPIPAPVFAIIYLAYSAYFLDRDIGNISHEAHIGGSLTGLVLAGLLSPQGFAPMIDRINQLLHH